MKCKICGFSHENTNSFLNHVRYEHKLKSKEYYDLYLKTENEGMCECGKETKFDNITKGYREFCSLKCSNSSNKTKQNKKDSFMCKYGVEYALQSEEIKNKRKKTNIEKYGCENVFQAKEIKNKIKNTKLEKYGDGKYTNREKAKETNLEKYGVENISQSKEIKEKIKETNLEKYGVEHYSKTKEYKNRKTKTNIEKYGVEHALQNKNIKNKMKQTNLEKYGCENVFQLEEIKEKIKETNLKKYGCENVFQLEEIQEKIKETNLKKYGCENYSQSDEYKNKANKTQRNSYWNMYNHLLNAKFIEPLFDKEYFCNIENTTYKFKCLKCNKEFEIQEYKNPQNIYCTCSGSSNIELDLLEWVKTLNVNVEGGKWFTSNNKRYELDIYLPEYNIGIEMDGHYYHSTEKKEENYHLNKTNWFKENYNIDVIHIVDLEWLDEENRKEIENIIKYKLGLEQLKENRYINNNVYDRRFFNNVEGVIKEPSILEFKTVKYEDCGYINTLKRTLL